MRSRSLVAALSATMCVGAAVAAPTALATTSARATLAGTAAPQAVQGAAAGAVSASSQVNFDLVLSLRDQSGAEALFKAVSTPGGLLYRHYLTAAQWEAEFSPTAADVTAAQQWLSSEGFSVGAVSKDRLTIAASGSAAQVESAFDTSLENYTVDGQTLRMASSDLSVPSLLAGIVVGAAGVNQTLATPADGNNPDVSSTKPATNTSTSSSSSTNPFPPAPAAFITHPPCSRYYGATTTTVSPAFGGGYPSTVPNIVCGYQPAQLRSGYGLTSANTGAGETVAVIDAYGSSTIDQDATRYFNTYAPSEPFSSADFSEAVATPFDDEAECAASGWATEQAIDIESVHSMAPDAHILYVGAQDCTDTGLLGALQYVIDDGLANVVTDSWADTGGDVLDDAATKTAYDDEFMLAGTTGITVQFSSGDDGDNFYLLGFSSANYPSSSPFVTAVGGTTLEVGANGQRIGEVGWDTGKSVLCTMNLIGDYPGCAASTLNTWLPTGPDGISGGYTSLYYTQPWYQAGVVPTDLSERNAPVFGPVPLRVVPDISLDADPGTGFLIGLHQMLPDGLSVYTTTRYGGTSLASPILAGIVADADQAAGQSLGFINPALYRMDLQDPSSINDILATGLQGNYREDFAGALGIGLNNGTTYATGTEDSYRELFYSGPETYCDGTGDCYSRTEPLTTGPGYDSLTGLGSPGTNFIGTLAEF
jgi:subtilase family serine protease